LGPDVNRSSPIQEIGPIIPLNTIIKKVYVEKLVEKRVPVPRQQAFMVSTLPRQQQGIMGSLVLPPSEQEILAFHSIMGQYVGFMAQRMQFNK
jgi:hypothetical protein